MTVQVDHSRCAYCGCCVGICPAGALWLDETQLVADPICTECGLCLPACPMSALWLEEPAAPGPSGIPLSVDVVVVGAGPAGSCAARAAAEQGVSVLLLEKRQEIGSPVRCAEGVGKAALEELVPFDERWISAHVTSAEISVMDGEECLNLAGGGGSGLILERRVFDRFLAEQAAASGAMVRVKTQVLGLIHNGSRVAGVRVRAGGKEGEISARIVIGADGVESWVGRWAGLSGAIPAGDQMTCAQYLLSNIVIEPHMIRYWISAGYAPGGYVWLFPKGIRSANVGLGAQSVLIRESPHHLLDRFIATQPALAGGQAVTMVSGGVPVAPAVSNLVGDGIMLVGDAARQADPLTGGGIIPGMVAGALAGRVAGEAVRFGRSDASALAAYPEEWNAGMGRALLRNYRLRSRFPPHQRDTRAFLRVFSAAAAGGK